MEIQSIDLASCRSYKDFGRGFYTTDILQQAQKMAKRVARIYGGNPIVNMYEIADNYDGKQWIEYIGFWQDSTGKMGSVRDE